MDALWTALAIHWTTTNQPFPEHSALSPDLPPSTHEINTATEIQQFGSLIEKMKAALLLTFASPNALVDFSSHTFERFALITQTLSRAGKVSSHRVEIPWFLNSSYCSCDSPSGINTH